MANQNTLFDLSVSPASNLNIKGQSQQGTAPGSTIDNIFQRYGAALKAFYDSLGGVATVSGTDTYTVTVTEDWAAYASGLVLAIKPANANTGAATLNITVPTAGALGAKAIRRQGDSALSANDMVANGVYLLRYSSTYNSSAGAWVLLNPAATSISTPVTEANGGTNQTTYTQGDLLYASASNTLAKLAKGTTGQVLGQTSTIPAWGSAITLATPTASTSGATIDYTSLPSWIRKITIMLGSVSTNGTSNVMVQIGDATSFKTSGYLSNAQFSSTVTAFTAGFGLVNSITAASKMSGAVELTLLDATNFIWVQSGNIISESGVTFVSGGVATLTGALTRVRFTMVNGTDTFDAGSVNIAYE